MEDNQSETSAQPKNIDMTRRDFIGMVAATAGLVGWTFSPEQATIPHNIESKLGYNLLPKTIEMITSSASTKFNDFMESNFDKHGWPIEINQTITHTELSITPVKDHRYAQSMKSTALKAIPDALNFWQSYYLRPPNYSLHIPVSKIDFDSTVMLPFKNNQSVPMHIVDETRYFYHSEADLVYRNGTKVSYQFKVSKVNKGEQHREYFINNGILTASRTAVFWNIKSRAQNLMETPPHEILHLQLSEYTDSALIKELNSHETPDSAKYNTLIVELTQEYINMEQFIVEMISEAWLDDYSRRLSIPPIALAGPSMAGARNEIVYRETPQKLIEFYCTQGPRAFSEKYN